MIPELRFLAENAGDAIRQLVALLPGHQAEHLYLTRSRIEDSSQHFDRSGFASAIRADKGEHFTLFERKANLLHSLALAIARSHKRTQAASQASRPFARPKRLRQPINPNDRHRDSPS